MSKARIINHHKLFDKGIDNLLDYCSDIINDKSKERSEKIMLTELLILKACSLWESFIEYEVVKLIELDDKSFKKEFEIPSKTRINEELIRAILFSDHYRDFGDVDRSTAFFDKVITEKNNAFKNITNDQKNKLKLIFTIRNYLAHHSRFSKKKLISMYKSKLNIEKFVEPSRLLLKSNGMLFDSLIHNFKLITSRMLVKIKVI